MGGFLMPLVTTESTKFLCLRWICAAPADYWGCVIFTQNSTTLGHLKWEVQKFKRYISKRNNYSKLSVHLEMSKAWNYSSETFFVCFGTIKYLKVFSHLSASYFSFCHSGISQPSQLFSAAVTSTHYAHSVMLNFGSIWCRPAELLLLI